MIEPRAAVKFLCFSAAGVKSFFYYVRGNLAVQLIICKKAWLFRTNCINFTIREKFRNFTEQWTKELYEFHVFLDNMSANQFRFRFVKWNTHLAYLDFRFRNYSYSPVGPWVSFYVFLVWMIYLFMCVYFVLPHIGSFFGSDVTNLNDPLFLPPPNYCGLGAGSIPLRDIVNKKQCESTKAYRLIITYWIGDYKTPRVLPFSKT